MLKNRLQSSKTVDLSRGHANTLTLDHPRTILIPTTMELTEKEWAAMASKYGYGINADKAIKDELVEFVETTIYLT